MRYAIAIVAVAGFALAAHAQNTRIIFEGSQNGGATWTSGRMLIEPGMVMVRVRLELVNAGTNTVLGLAGITMQPTLSNFTPSGGDSVIPFSTPDGSGVEEHPQTTLGRILPFAAAGMGPMSASGVLTWHLDPGNVLRFAGANATTPNSSWGVGSGQLPRANNPTDFRTGTNVVIFRYGVNLRSFPQNFEWTASVNPVNILQQRGNWYRTENGVGNLLAPIGAEGVVPLRIVIPGPGVVAMIGLAGLTRRRRRGTA